MRRLSLSLCCLLLVALMPAPAMAHPLSMLAPTLPTDVTYASTDNIDYHGRFPEHAGTAGGMGIGDRYYVTDPRGVYVYDTSEPTAPELLGSLTHYQSGLGAALAQEDPNTDGDILVVDGAPSLGGSARVSVIDVSDPAAGLSLIGTVNRTDHTWTCVSGLLDDGTQSSCAYAFGRSGHIIDITAVDRVPVDVPDVTWRTLVNYGTRSNSPYTHDLTEVRPGLVMSAGSTAILMDTSALLTPGGTPADIREISRIDQSVHGHGFSSLGYHSVEWAVDADGRMDDILIGGTEIAPSGTTNLAGSDCTGDESVIETFDASAVSAAIAAWEAGDLTFEEMTAQAEFSLIDSFDAAGRGAYVDGKAPAHVLYCAHWMELAPDFDGGGMVAVSYYDRGTRFVEVLEDGTFADEHAWIVPFQGYSGSAQWVTADVLYIHDYTRGMEVITLDRAAATGVVDADSPMALSSNYTPPPRMHVEDMAAPAMLLLALAAIAVEQRRRQQVRR